MASLLLLTQPLPRIISELPKVLEAAAKYSSKRLYIHWDCFPLKNVSTEYCNNYHNRIVSSIYQTSSHIIPAIDVRVVLHGFKLHKGIWSPSFSVENFLIDVKHLKHLEDIKIRYKNISSTAPVFLLEKLSPLTNNYESDCGLSEVAEQVVIGGTFDHIHTGHKILLSESIFRTNKRLTIGMADGPLLEKKTLKDLIMPCEMRMKELKEFLIDIDSTIEYNLVPITEPMGPTSWDESLQLIVVSEETEKAVNYINNHRNKKGLNLLKKYVIKLVEDELRSEGEEIKYSSSSIRRRLLGTRLKPCKPNTNIPIFPYIIGLTGGSASGKSNIASYLSKLGAAVIDCDVLGHKAYTKGSNCYKMLVNKFGIGILSGSEEIDRKILGSIVFQNEEKLNLLNSIVWPEIKNMINEKIDSFRKLGTSVVVLDAAVLIKADWNESCHETWVCFVEKEEAVKRIMNRDKKSITDAEDRIARQMANKDILKYADIAFCSEFQYEFTQSQVVKAWHILEADKKIRTNEAHL